ncbi:Nif3-like dinuclear metal center hexameric protein [Roseiconus nitratireducens]|uniref:GTP cyclohydrolase 1 type 2 homolog n=1 Tax=Roseiconus nitratireducens TaxID=2605748 RepID=A0A5M6CYA4_9BACT|nr:Nif3-like dinuclear metal center hexameric protein [Roseiconus nitratireducens]KAA5540083.1 Nif3-like dinuclear metal center hexameric protein [Roseiconus nitratireducens]
MSVSLESVCGWLAEIAPLGLAESWDNVGLLLGDPNRSVERVMTCLTVTDSVVDEAVQERVDLIVSHHPIPFRPLSQITSDTLTGRWLWSLCGSQTAVYSAHTAFDSASEGINQTWAESLELRNVQSILPPEGAATLGSGRYGDLPAPQPVGEIVRRCARQAASPGPVRMVGTPDSAVTRVGFACGSGGSFVSAAHRAGCQLLITGEATFHQCLEAEALGMGLGLLGHYQSERFAMEILAEKMAANWPQLSIWPSRRESDPIVQL